MAEEQSVPGPGSDPGPPPSSNGDTAHLPPVYGETVYEETIEEVPPIPDEPPHIPPEELSGLYGDGVNAPSSSRRILPLDDEPSSIVARYLFPTEKFRGEWRKHWVALSKPGAIGIAATLLLGWLTGFSAKHGNGGIVSVVILVWLAVLGWVAWKIGDWYYDRFILTNKRIMKVSGIIDRNVAMMPLLRVTDMKYEQNAWGRTLRYGTFVVESAGQDQALRRVPFLPNPNELYLRIVEEMYEPEAVEARLSHRDEEEGT